MKAKCEHPYEAIEFIDDETQGECGVCGAYCDWEWMDDELVSGEMVKTKHPTVWYDK